MKPFAGSRTALAALAAAPATVVADAGVHARASAPEGYGGDESDGEGY